MAREVSGQRLAGQERWCQPEDMLASMAVGSATGVTPMLTPSRRTSDSRPDVPALMGRVIMYFGKGVLAEVAHAGCWNTAMAPRLPHALRSLHLRLSRLVGRIHRRPHALLGESAQPA